MVAGEIGQLADTSRTTAASIQTICNEANDSISAVNACFDSIMSFIEKDVVVQFEDIAGKSNQNSDSVDRIKEQLDIVQKSVKNLEDSVGKIAISIDDVNRITEENQSAIGVIVEKSENTSEVAAVIQKQASDNQEIAGQMKGIVGKFRI